MKRTIVFGDIHGCYDEWQALLEKTKASRSDDLICVGDLICKGPASVKVLEAAISMPNLRCVMGNHEYQILRAWKKKSFSNLAKDYQAAFVKEMGSNVDRYMRFIDTWPFYLDLDACLVVHAGIRTGTPPAKQSETDLVYLRTLEDGTPWYEHYNGKKLIVHGHWARQGLTVRDNVIGLDSGCVYGKKLSAVILPERKIVSVNAKKNYSGVFAD